MIGIQCVVRTACRHRAARGFSKTLKDNSLSARAKRTEYGKR